MVIYHRLSLLHYFLQQTIASHPIASLLFTTIAYLSSRYNTTAHSFIRDRPVQQVITFIVNLVLC